MTIESTPSGSARPTLRDIAEVAGTSTMTVSRALNGQSGVSQATADRIRALAQDLGYRRNGLAQALRQGTRSDTIGLVLEQAQTRFFRGLIAGVQQVASARESLVLTATSGSSEREQASVLALSRSRVDGMLVVLSGLDRSFLLPDHVGGVPVVFVDREPPGEATDCVLADDFGGAWRATQHLLRNGHRRIGVVGGPPTIQTVLRRVDGHRQALMAGRVRDHPGSIILGCRQIGAAEQAVRRLLSQEPPPTALFTLNEVCTLGALRALKALGVGGSVALVAFDDFEAAELLSPAVTVIQHDLTVLGRRAAGILFERIDGGGGPARTITLDTQLVIRGSGEVRGPHAPIIVPEWPPQAQDGQTGADRTS